MTANEKKKGQFTIVQKKKKREIIQEGGHQVDVPPDVGEEEKKALDQTETTPHLDGKETIFSFFS